ncbi:hypothetical protein DENSPDRAFT_625927 [Dentipellis sp. KUC8613]|nr:hypothetical protein DENSPDRAFT_625927 [Dentipellis sp. KUC8613]
MSSQSSTIYTKQFDSTDNDRPVSQILVYASGNISTAQDLPDIWHWQLHLLPSADPRAQDSDNPPTRTIVLDMIPAVSPTGTLCILSKAPTELPLHLPTSASLAFAPLTAITVRHIVDLFLSKGMDRYTYNERYTGCVFWVRTAVERLQDAGWVEGGAAEKFDAFYKEQAALRPGNFEEPFGRGEFY